MRRLKPLAHCFLLASWLIAIQSASAAPVLGDEDHDLDIDLADYRTFANCVSSFGSPAPLSCDMFDFVPGLTFDQSDYELWSCGFGGPGAAVIAVTADPPLSPTSALDVILSGTTAGATAVQISGGLQTVSIPTNGCDYSVLVALRPNVVNHLFVTGIFGDGISSAPFPVTVVQDAQPPNLFVDYPPANAEITTATTDVAGRVGDALSGFDGMRVKVAVNDGPFIPAAVDIGIGTNLTYFLPSVSLDLGTNTITVRAFDGLENAVEKQIVVTRVDIPIGTPAMSVFSGNAQSAPIHGVLSQPIEVRILSSKGFPMEGKLVNFNIVRSDGRLASSSGGLFPGAEVLQAFTDTEGTARAFWRLGSDAGRGNNRVEVSSESVVGTTFFCASATAGSATQINIGGGNNQRSEAGAPAPELLNIWVSDSCNPVSGIEVTFSVRQGGGRVNGFDAVTLNTDSSGHAEVAFTLGAVGGNNIIEAGFPGNPNAPAVFNIVGVVRDAKIPTRFSGLVFDNAGQPIQGATCALVMGGVTLPFVTSDSDGQFRFDTVPSAGPADLHVAGASATHVGGVSVPPNSFPSLRYSIIVVPNAANSLPTPVLLPKLDPANARLYSTTQDTELTVAGMVGLKMIVKAGSMRIRSAGQFVPAPNGTAISLNQVHHDDVPMPLPDGAAPPFAWTLQPGGAQFDPPVTIFYPNISGLPAGAIANFLTFNHDSGKFEIIASGHVIADGTTIVSDPGSGISVAGWGCNCPPYAVTGSCHHCSESQAAGSGPNCCIPACTECQICDDGQCFRRAIGTPCSGGCGSCTLFGCQEFEDETSCGGRCNSCVSGSCIPNGIECGVVEGCCNFDQVCCFLDGPRFVCLNPGALCCGDGTYCLAEQPLCCNGECCEVNETCCGNHCCDFDEMCCGSECYPENTVCCSDGGVCNLSVLECCNLGCQPIGRICCPGSTLVCDAEHPLCCNNQCCASNQVCCNDGCGNPGHVCCPFGGTCHPSNPVCCSPDCCCTAAQTCCSNGAACSCVPMGQPCP